MHLDILAVIDDDVTKTENTLKPEPRQCMEQRILQLLICGLARKNSHFNSVPVEIIKVMCHWATDGITYKEVLNVLLHGRCCIGVYDYKMSKWRTAVYMKHWDNVQAIMVRYVCGFPDNGFVILNTFPTCSIDIHSLHFCTTYQILKNQSHLAKQYLDDWTRKYTDYNKVTHK